jgi:hypothetical protein
MAHTRITRYCKICGDLVIDKTRGNNKLICDNLKCKKEFTLTRVKEYNQRVRKTPEWKKKQAEWLLKLRMRNKHNLPKWRCSDCGWEKQLDFDPLGKFATKKIQAIKCEKCEQEKTAD